MPKSKKIHLKNAYALLSGSLDFYLVQRARMTPDKSAMKFVLILMKIIKSLKSETFCSEKVWSQGNVFVSLLFDGDTEAHLTIRKWLESMRNQMA